MHSPTDKTERGNKVRIAQVTRRHNAMPAATRLAIETRLSKSVSLLRALQKG